MISNAWQTINYSYAVFICINQLFVAFLCINIKKDLPQQY